MWISRRLSQAIAQPRAERGNVMLSDNAGMEAGGTFVTRDVDSYQPYGYSSVPPVGEEVMLLPSANGQVVLGTRSHPTSAAGEVVISSLGGARIVLKNDGTIQLNSLVIDRNGVIQD